MGKKKIRIFELDGDKVTVPQSFDKEIGDYVNEYPDFRLTPRITPLGRRWVNAIDSGCPYADKKYGDCGSCEFFRCEKAGDLIGICTNEKIINLSLRKEEEA